MTAVVPDLSAFPGVAVVEVDGVPVLLAPREGNVGGGIVFRVGSADETLATSGITHLIEHLALQTQVLSEAHLNGQTHADVTLFHVAGSTEEVVRYLNDVCTALRAGLPLDRLETEKEILRSEADGKNPGFVGRLRIERHGAQGYGLLGYGERGTDRLTADEVREWTATWFTRANAVAWITADALPDGLDLRLPPGRRMLAPAVTDVLRGTPAYSTGLEDGVVIDAVTRRGPATVVACRVIEQVLHRELRRDADIADEVGVAYDGLDDEHARVLVTVRAAEGHPEAAAGGLADALGRLRHHVSDGDLAAARAFLRDEMAQAAAAPAAEMLPSLAYRMLHGRPLEGTQQVLEQYEQVTADDVRAAVRGLWEDALWYGPVPMGHVGAVPAPQWSVGRVEGRTFPRLDDPTASLVIGDDGVSHVTDKGAVTVRFADCVLVEMVPDGACALTGVDGFYVSVEPTLYRDLDGATVAAAVDANVPGDVVVHLPARDPDRIPVPRPPAPAPSGRRRERKGAADGPLARRSPWATALWVVALWVGVLVAFVALEAGIEAATGDEPSLGFLPMVVLFWSTFALIRRRHPKESR